MRSLFMPVSVGLGTRAAPGRADTDTEEWRGLALRTRGGYTLGVVAGAWPVPTPRRPGIVQDQIPDTREQQAQIARMGSELRTRRLFYAHLGVRSRRAHTRRWPPRRGKRHGAAASM